MPATALQTSPPPTLLDSGSLQVRIRLSSTLAVVRVAGELDLCSEYLLADALDCITAASCPAPLVVLDLAGVTFCDAAGLHALRDCATRMGAEGKELRLTNVSRPVARLLAIGQP